MAVTSYISQIHVIDSISNLTSSLGHDGDICFYIPEVAGNVRGLYFKLKGAWNEVMIENGIKTFTGLAVNATYAERLDNINAAINAHSSEITDILSTIDYDKSRINLNSNQITQLNTRLTTILAKINTAIQGVGVSEYGNDVTYTQPDTNESVTVTVGNGAEIYNIQESPTYRNIAVNEFSHAEGKKTIGEGTASHAEGVYTYAKGTASHAEGNETMATAAQSHAEGSSTQAKGINSHAEGSTNQSKAINSHTEGAYNIIDTDGHNAHAEGSQNTVNSTNAHAEGGSNNVTGDNAHAEGSSNRAINNSAHTEGSYNKSDGTSSHTEGTLNEATNNASHAEGKNTRSQAEASHSEGINSIASASAAHAEGNTTTASGVNSHSSGANTVASGVGSFAEGSYTTAAADYSHAAGLYTRTKDNYSFVIGKYNDYSILASTLFMVGNGTDDDHRSNALYLTSNGELHVASDIVVNGVSFNSLNVETTFFGSQAEYEQAVSNNQIGNNATVIKYDTSVTANSTNLITSGAVYTAVNNVSNSIPVNYLVSVTKNLQNNTYTFTPSVGEAVTIEASAGISGGYLKSAALDSDASHYMYTFTRDDTTEFTITVDKSVAENSTNLVTSDAVYQAINAMGSGGSPVFFGTEAQYAIAENNSEIRPETVAIKYDNNVTERSNNLVTSGAVYDAINLAMPSLIHSFTQAEITSDINEIWE